MPNCTCPHCCPTARQVYCYAYAVAGNMAAAQITMNAVINYCLTFDWNSIPWGSSFDYDIIHKVGGLTIGGLVFAGTRTNPYPNKPDDWILTTWGGQVDGISKGASYSLGASQTQVLVNGAYNLVNINSVDIGGGFCGSTINTSTPINLVCGSISTQPFCPGYNALAGCGFPNSPAEGDFEGDTVYQATSTSNTILPYPPWA